MSNLKQDLSSLAVTGTAKTGAAAQTSTLHAAPALLDNDYNTWDLFAEALANLIAGRE